MNSFKKCFIALSVLMAASGCAGNASKPFETVTAHTVAVDNFGDVAFDINEIDLAYGDSVNLSFSGGYSLSEIPFYPDYYGSKGDVILTDFTGEIAVAGINHSFNDTAQIEIGETVTITLDEREKYKRLYEAYNIDPDKTPWEGQTNAEYMNARMVTAGKIAQKTLYRSASPFEASFGRVELMDSYIQTNNIQCILDLAEPDEVLQEYKDLPEHTAAMIANGQVIGFTIGNDFKDPVAMESIGNGLRKMLTKDGPYLVQCSLGRDRTGVMCALLELLCDASYEEAVADYMESYNLLHNIDVNLEVGSDSTQYDLFKARLDDALEEVLETGKEELPSADLKTKVHSYFNQCGLTDAEIDQLSAILQGNS